MNISLLFEKLNDGRSALARRPESRASPTLVSVQTTRQQFGSEDASTVQLSRSERAQRLGSDRALRKLNEASGYVSVAQNATKQIGLLVDKALQIAQTLETALPADVRDSLAQEGEDALEEIDTIVSDATFKNVQVINSGAQVFTVNLDAADESSASSYAIHVQNVAVSRNQLSLSSLTANSFLNSATATAATLENAQLSVENNLSNLDDSQQEIENAASHFGLVSSVQAADVRSDNGLNPEKLASDISAALGRTLAEASHNLDPLRVQDLLAAGNEDSSSAGTDSSTAASTLEFDSEDD